MRDVHYTGVHLYAVANYFIESAGRPYLLLGLRKTFDELYGSSIGTPSGRIKALVRPVKALLALLKLTSLQK